MKNSGAYLDEMAIIGMAGRFPGAQTVDEFWQNLRDGVESISFLSDEELESSGVSPAVFNRPEYIRSRCLLEDVASFDASFFGFTPREAEVMDPQQRLFLECAWEALENAGYDSETYKGVIGVYAGTEASSYASNNLYPNRDLMELVGPIQVMLGNDKDYLTTRVSYKLNLKGPSVAVQTTCSTSLVAVHLAYQSLLNGECDVALAGGVTIIIPRKMGRLYREGTMGSPDGHCRAFDARAQGTTSGEGVGVVVLKRLEDALVDGDCIYVVIKGSAINNDGSSKAGYTAPSVDGQARVIAEALAMARVEPETVTYVETHGTGTPLGDPIEIAALTQAFRTSTQKKGFCAIGSVKTNIGHLSQAAGVAGLIKTVLALKHKMILPSLNFERPNPKIDFANTPFYVNTTLSEWKAGNTPRRAGVSSFGIGGTNAHVVLEEAPAVEPSGASRPWQLLVLSAKTGTALETATANLVEHLKRHSDLNLADVAYTLQIGRRAFSHRRMLVCRDLDDAVTALETMDPQRVFTLYQKPKERPVLFMFPGQGAQYVNMALELYQVEPVFREQVDLCSEFLKPHLGLDLRNVLYPSAGSGQAPSEEQAKEGTQQLEQTAITQPALFVIEYALAKLWMEWGVRPQAMIGHSIGEYVAACLAGVFPLEHALALVAARGRLMQELPGGAMLSVSLSEKEIQPLLSEGLSLAAVNGPSLCVASGPTAAVDELEHQLAENGLAHRRLRTSHAFHSEMMEVILGPFTEEVKKVNLQPPQIPYVSNVTGTWIMAAEATDPSYWARHLRQTVRFSDGVQRLLEEPDWILLEVGPGRTSSTLVRQHLDRAAGQIVLTSLRHPREQYSDVAFLLGTLGRLWLAATRVGWSGFYAHERRHRVLLPTYPFERQRHWIAPPQRRAHSASTRQRELGKKPDIADWFYIPVWKRSMPPAPSEPGNMADQEARWLVFLGACGLGSQLVKRLEQEDQDVITVMIGDQFTKHSDHAYTISPQQRDDYDALIKELCAQDRIPRKIVHLWSVTSNDHTRSGVKRFKESQNLGFYSLLFLAQALEGQGITDSLQIEVVSSDMQDVTGLEVLCPGKATVLGPCKVIPQEYPNITCRSIDITVPRSATWQEERLIGQLVVELTAKPPDLVVAYRGNHRWVQTFEAVRPAGEARRTTRLWEGGSYLIIGGLEDVALVYAEYLAQSVRAKLILIERSTFPERDEREQWLATHDDQDSISRKIREVQALEELGAEVLVVSADATNQEQMREAITQACERFGEIHGVIYAEERGFGEKLFSPIHEIDRTECERQFQSKVYGLLVLEEILKERKLDFCLLQCSLSSVLGGLGFVAYAAANTFVDAFAHKHNQTNPGPWVSVNWDGRQLGEGKVQSIAPGATLAELAIKPEESAEVFEHILAVGAVDQVVISTGDLQARIDRWIKRESLRGTDRLEEADVSSPRSRLNLQSAYVAPRNEIEQAIADIWQELLGIDQVGIYDNFFELGGHSLLASQLISRLRQTLPVELPLRTLLETPTVAQIGKVVEEMLIEKVKVLSEDEVRRLL